MPRGRPRKNPLPEVKETEAEVKNEETKNEFTTSSTSSIKKKATLPCCECCGVPMPTTPNRVNLTYLTSVAPYHFKVKNCQPYLCTSCAIELSKVVDKWLISHGAEEKFGDVL